MTIKQNTSKSMEYNEGSPKREVFILSPTLKKMEKFCINNLMIHPKTLEKTRTARKKEQSGKDVQNQC